MDSYAIDLIYDENGKKRKEEDVIQDLENEDIFDPPYVFSDRPKK